MQQDCSQWHCGPEWGFKVGELKVLYGYIGEANYVILVFCYILVWYSFQTSEVRRGKQISEVGAKVKLTNVSVQGFY